MFHPTHGVFTDGTLPIINYVVEKRLYSVKLPEIVVKDSDVGYF